MAAMFIELEYYLQAIGIVAMTEATYVELSRGCSPFQFNDSSKSVVSAQSRLSVQQPLGGSGGRVTTW
jgi:hypothetical protein